MFNNGLQGLELWNDITILQILKYNFLYPYKYIYITLLFWSSYLVLYPFLILPFFHIFATIRHPHPYSTVLHSCSPLFYTTLHPILHKLKTVINPVFFVKPQKFNIKNIQVFFSILVIFNDCLFPTQQHIAFFMILPLHLKYALMRLTSKGDDAKLTARIRIYKIFICDVTEQILSDVRSSYAPEARRQSK
jgi:hypothetical protein